LRRSLIAARARATAASTGSRIAEINRRLTSAEYREALTMARDVGLRRLDARLPDSRLLARLVAR